MLRQDTPELRGGSMGRRDDVPLPLYERKLRRRVHTRRIAMRRKRAAELQRRGAMDQCAVSVHLQRQCLCRCLRARANEVQRHRATSMQSAGAMDRHANMSFRVFDGSVHGRLRARLEPMHRPHPADVQYQRQLDEWHQLPLRLHGG